MKRTSYYFVGFAPAGAIFECLYGDHKMTYMLLESFKGDGRGNAVKVLTLHDERYGQPGTVDLASIIDEDERIA